MNRRAVGSLLLVAAAAPALAGCESTQSKNARAEAKGRASVTAETGLAVTTPNADVTATAATVLTDPEVGSAVVVELENGSGEAQRSVPVLVNVTDPAGAEVFTNGTPGLGRSLTHAAVVQPGKSVWVNDQVPITQGAEAATAAVGAPEGATDAAPPVTFSATAPQVVQDPVSGLAASGFVKHDSADELRRVVVSVVARKGKRIVAAGRGVVARVKAGKRARYQAFLIGDPTGAELSATAQPDIDAE